MEDVFCLRESVAPQAPLPGIQMETDRSQHTNLPGCFVVGDAPAGPINTSRWRAMVNSSANKKM